MSGADVHPVGDRENQRQGSHHRDRNQLPLSRGGARYSTLRSGRLRFAVIGRETGDVGDLFAIAVSWQGERTCRGTERLPIAGRLHGAKVSFNPYRLKVLGGILRLRRAAPPLVGASLSPRWCLSPPRHTCLETRTGAATIEIDVEIRGWHPRPITPPPGDRARPRVTCPGEFQKISPLRL